MLGLAKIIYRLSLLLYKAGIHLAAPFNTKAKTWVQGRKQQRDNAYNLPEGCLWVHCASLGEYEQGRPVIDALHNQHPETPIVVTFFSPSGYEVVKKRDTVHNTLYLPLDGPQAARQFLNRINPKLAVFVKYEFWYYYLAELNRRQVPTYLVSGIFRKDSVFFKPWGGLHRHMLGSFTHLFVQNSTSKALLGKIDVTHVSVTGDTRFDRVISLLQHPVELPVIERFTANTITLVAGSTWAADEEHLVPLINEYSANPGIKFIIAPHEITESGILRLTMNLRPLTVLYSENQKKPLADAKVLIIDSIGILSQVYKYGRMAYIGGGFGNGIHNILEPAAQGLPIIFGPNYGRFKEAVDLVELKAAFPVQTTEQLRTAYHDLLNNPTHLNAASVAAREYVERKTGATKRLIEQLEF